MRTIIILLTILLSFSPSFAGWGGGGGGSTIATDPLDTTKAASATKAEKLEPVKTTGEPGVSYNYEAEADQIGGYGTKGPLNVSGAIKLEMPPNDNPTNGQIQVFGTPVSRSESGNIPAHTELPFTWGARGAVINDETDSDTETLSSNEITSRISAVEVGALPYTEQSADPTSESTDGYFYGATSSGDFFFKSTTGLFNISAGTYSLDPSIPTYSSSAILAVGNVIEMTFSEAVTKGSGWTEFLFTVDGSVTGSDIGMTVTSGDGTTQLTALLDSVIQEDEVVTLDFAGATDGLESSTGGDLAEFSGSAVTNNSTQGGTTDYYVGAPNTAGTPTGSYTGPTISSYNNDYTGTREYTATADGDIIGINLYVKNNSYEQGWIVAYINGSRAGYAEITGASSDSWTGEISFASPIAYNNTDIIRFGFSMDNDATNGGFGSDNTDSSDIYRSTADAVEGAPPETPTLTVSGATGLMSIMHIQE